MTDLTRLNRRHFLRGAGGFTLAVPFLSSVLPRAARAQAAAQRQKRFVFIGSDHGGVFLHHLLPPTPSAQTRVRMFGSTAETPEHFVHHSPLRATVTGTRAAISPTLEAPRSLLSDRMVGQMNVVTGLDVTTYLGHHRAMLGNYGSNDDGNSSHIPNMASIDQLMAWSPAFNVVTPVERSINVALDYAAGTDIRFQLSAERRGNSLSGVQPVFDARSLWDRLFAGRNVGSAAPDRPLVVDRVLAHYRSLRDGAFGDAARMSSADRARLDAHLERLFELERKLEAARPVGCTEPSRPSRSNVLSDELARTVEVTAAALRCGLSHVAVLGISARELSPDVGWTNWHEQVAHNGGGGQRVASASFQAINYRAQREVFEQAFLRIADALDEDAGGGRTYLDDSVVTWVMESGEVTHDNFGMTAVMAGGAGGHFHTGRYVDLRNRDNRIAVSPNTPDRRPGTVYNRFLSNLLQSMGLGPADFAAEMQRVQASDYANGRRGYGWTEYDDYEFGIDPIRQVWPEMHYRSADDPLPGLVA